MIPSAPLFVEDQLLLLVGERREFAKPVIRGLCAAAVPVRQKVTVLVRQGACIFDRAGLEIRSILLLRQIAIAKDVNRRGPAVPRVPAPFKAACGQAIEHSALHQMRTTRCLREFALREFPEGLEAFRRIHELLSTAQCL